MYSTTWLTGSSSGISDADILKATGRAISRVGAARLTLALLAALSGMAGPVDSPAALANHLTVLHLDLTDPEFHALTLEHARTVRGEFQALLDAAGQADELRPCDTARLAEALQVAYNGALVTWAIDRRGRLDSWIGGQAELLLDPYRLPIPAQPGQRSSSRRR